MKDSYEKVLLVVAAIAAIALAVFGFLKTKAVEGFSEASENPRSSPPIQGEVLVNESAASLAKPPRLEPVVVGQVREVENFTGVDLFVRRGEETPLDLLAPETKPVHPPIPNRWWTKNGIDPGFADSPQRDHDEDGFSNIEEYDAKTNPADSNSFPSLFAKIKVAGVDKEQWYLRFSNFGGTSLRFNIEGKLNGKLEKTKGNIDKPTQVGEVFFEEGGYKGRFKYVELLKKDVRGIEKEFAKVEDQKVGKAGKTYEIPSGAHRTLQTDYSARLYLDTPDEVGTKFTVEEGMSFSLPYDPDATEKPYTLKEIQNDGTKLLLQWENNGETKQLELDVPN